MVEVVENNGKKFVRIDPDDIDVSNMTLAHKVGDVVAAQVKKGRVKVVTQHNGEVETINYAGVGDWLVYDVGASSKREVIDILLESEKQAMTRDGFAFLYAPIEGDIALSAQDILRLTQDLVMDNDDNPEFIDSSFINNLKKYRYVGRNIFAARVPFNFVIRTPLGGDQLIEKGGIIVYDNNITQTKRREIYGIEGAHNRQPGQFEKTYALANATAQGSSTKVSPDGSRTIADTFQIVIKADRSPIAGIQFNNVDLSKAYVRASKELPKWLNKFLPNEEKNKISEDHKGSNKEPKKVNPGMGSHADNAKSKLFSAFDKLR